MRDVVEHCTAYEDGQVASHSVWPVGCTQVMRRGILLGSAGLVSLSSRLLPGIVSYVCTTLRR